MIDAMIDAMTDGESWNRARAAGVGARSGTMRHAEPTGDPRFAH
jgi:hypothetical protein